MNSTAGNWIAEWLTGLGAIDRFPLLPADAQAAVSNANALVAAKTLPVMPVVNHLHAFSGRLSPFGAHTTFLVTHNGAEITAAIKNIDTASVVLINLLHDLQTKQSGAGRLLRDEQTGSNLDAIAENLAVTTSSLNRRGLGSIRWKPKAPPTNVASARILTPARDPFD